MVLNVAAAGEYITSPGVTTQVDGNSVLFVIPNP
jgi:hypothetical protein